MPNNKLNICSMNKEELHAAMLSDGEWNLGFVESFSGGYSGQAWIHKDGLRDAIPAIGHDDLIRSYLFIKWVSASFGPMTHNDISAIILEHNTINKMLFDAGYTTSDTATRKISKIIGEVEMLRNNQQTAILCERERCISAAEAEIEDCTDSNDQYGLRVANSIRTVIKRGS